MRMIMLLALITLFTGGSAFAGELDIHYLQQFGESPTPYSYLLKNVQTETVHKCGMPLRHDLKRDWKKLEAGTQKVLAKHLGKPILENARTATSIGSHFIIHYASTGADAPPLTDSDSNSIPDWIETVGNVFESVYNQEVTAMGYTAPPTSPPGTPYHVYLQNISYFGLTDSDIVTGQSATSYITIENDFAETGFQKSIPGNDSASVKSLKALQITAAHEFHHAIQFGYNFYFEPWYAEATSSWMEDEVYDSVNQTYDYLDTYLTNTASSLNYGHGYDRWIFNRHLAEKFDVSSIRSIWERIQSTQGSGGDIPTLPVIDLWLKSRNSSLSSELVFFAKRLYTKEWTSHTDEIPLIYSASVAIKANYTAYPVNHSTFPAPSITLPGNSFAYFKFTPSSSVANLTISVNRTTGIQTSLFKKTSDGITEIPLNSGGTASTYSYTVNGFGALDHNTEEVVLMAVNITSVDNHMVSISSDGSTGQVTEPSTAPPATSGGSGGGGCFIATAAYGSYLHPEVITLREFRDSYLLTNLPGRAFVAVYYNISPPIADFIREHESARFIIRVVLAPIIFSVKHLWVAVATFAALVSIALLRIRTRFALRNASEHRRT